ncbi:MAG TPA: CinA family protein [Candidatus Limnocylindrales bacterium]|nr:CinA family protein [Candidatus Limnocylindrales bacterium]
MGGDPLVELAGRLQGACLAAGRRVALAESCTGGMVAAAITAVPGSSAYFLGGIVSYGDRAKRELLGVDGEVLAAHGAVSAQAARAMALAARERFGADLAGSVTGVAGPAGGSAAKPIGLTYVGVADGAGVDVRRVLWTGDRTANRLDSARLVLELLVERVAGTAAATAGEPTAGEPTAEGSQPEPRG